MEKSKIFKYITVGVFLFTILCIFMPYARTDNVAINGFNVIRFGLGLASSTANFLFGSRGDDIMAATIIVFILPVVLLILSGIIMLFKTSIPKTIFVVIFSVISFLITNAFIQELNGINIGTGLRFVQIIPLIGIILSITTIVLYKKENKQDSTK